MLQFRFVRIVDGGLNPQTAGLSYRPNINGGSVDVVNIISLKQNHPLREFRQGLLESAETWGCRDFSHLLWAGRDFSTAIPLECATGMPWC